MAFHEVRFPTAVSLRASGSIERRLQVVTLTSGYEERNTPWADSKRHYDAGYGVRHVNDLHQVIAFFEARRGGLYGFRWKDWSDYRSGLPGKKPTPFDQEIGVGDGVTRRFELKKRYGEGGREGGAEGGDAWERRIHKPVAQSVEIAVNGSIVTDYTLDSATGEIAFTAPPAQGSTITAGFEFDTPVRFESEHLEISLSGFEAGEIPSIPLVELRL